MNTEPVIGDALGAALLAHLEAGGDEGRHAVERDDGYLSSDPATPYFTQIGKWFAVEESVPQRVSGRVLDIGAGAGRFAIELQNRGHDVVALDVSDGCLEVCRRRGVRTTFSGTIFDLAETDPQPFDTFLLMGHNIGLLAGPEKAPAFLDALRAMASPTARLLGTNRDPMATSDPDNLRYHQQNRERGRHPGQMLIRVRWRALATEWFDYWFLSVNELETLAADRGWTLCDTEFEDVHYLAHLELET
jgi:SAM-dependent methyltransferase